MAVILSQLMVHGQTAPLMISTGFHEYAVHRKENVISTTAMRSGAL